MKKLLSALFLLITINLSAQQEQRFWIFGHNTNTNGNLIPAHIEFPNGNGIPQQMTPAPTVNQGQELGFEGTAVATDPLNGNLLFYTDGRFVYNGDNQVLDLDPSNPGFEELGASSSCSQPVALSVVPVCPFNQYYIFSNPTGTVHSQDFSFGPVTFRTYNTTTNTFGPQQSLPGIGGNASADEGMVIVPSTTDPLTNWLIYRLHNDTDINNDGILERRVHLVYRISPNGVTFHSAASFGPSMPTGPNNRYILNIAQRIIPNTNNAILGFVNSRRNLYTINFNTQTGQFNTATVTNIPLSTTTVPGNIYDIEFSPDCSRLYLGTHSASNLYQINLQSNPATVATVLTFGDTRGGGLKLGPDERIYHINNGGTTDNPIIQIGAITNPNELFTTNTDINQFYDNSILPPYLDVTGYNFPEFVRTPLWNATAEIVAGDELICEGESVELTATANTMNMAILGFQWFRSTDPENPNSWTPIPGATALNYSANLPGHYRIQILLNNGCSIFSNGVMISRPENICECDANFQYLSNTTISHPTVWEGRVTIADNVTLTVNSSLDITNVDVVLGQCANIRFTATGSLRANNSVFRPCEKNETWGGLIFIGSQNNVINECTFKNAIVATYFSGDGHATISNNLFQNNSISIQVQSSVFEKSITGNQFETNQEFPFTNEVSCSSDLAVRSSANKTTFIWMNYAAMSGHISQNRFINNHKTGIEATGIYATRLNDIEISGNHFTDVFESIYLSNSAGCCPTVSYNLKRIAITDNIMVMNSKKNYENVIYLMGLDSTTVSNNEIRNSVNDKQEDIPAVGIGIYFSTRANIKNNYISGVKQGISTYNLSNSQIVDNKLINAYDQAISLSNVNNVTVACNTIDLNHFHGTGTKAAGIAIINPYGNTSRIHSNCITDCSNSIYLSGTGTIFPNIQNNFMYNYSNFGIYVSGMNGQIGSASNPGTNTFYSNSMAYDVAAVNGTVNVYDNYNLKRLSGVYILSNSQRYSTASCAMQTIGTPAQNNLNPNLVCDEMDYLYSTYTSGMKFSSVPEDHTLNYGSIDHSVDVSVNKLKVYPNPASETITVELVTEDISSSVTKLQILDVTGRVMKEVTPSIVGGVFDLPIDELTPGMYMIQMIGSSGKSKNAVFIKK